jgi:hypothetical protein
MKPSRLCLALFLLAGLEAKRADALDFKKDIRPILNKKCFKCHSGPRAKGKLRMDSESDFAKRIGGDDPVIVPGEPGKSLLPIKAGLPASDGDAMPPPPARPRGAEPMTTVELNLVKQWISEGASFEEGGGSAPTTSTTEPAPTSEKKDEIHTWTNQEGKTLKASFLRAEPGKVVLKMENGEELAYPFDKLNADSQALARKLATAE